MLPLTRWHVAAAPALALAMLAVALRRRRDPARRIHLAHPRHLDELARAVATASPPGRAAVSVARTSLGIQISTGDTDGTRHFTVSRLGGVLAEAEARALAGVLVRLRGDGGAVEVVSGRTGVYHVVVRDHVTA